MEFLVNPFRSLSVSLMVNRAALGTLSTYVSTALGFPRIRKRI